MGKEIRLPAGTTHVPYRELADLIASALWPSRGPDDFRLRYGGARLNLEDELRRAVDSCVLPVKDPLTLGPHPCPQGNVLMSALVTVEALGAFVADRGVTVVIDEPDAATVTHAAAPVPGVMDDHAPKLEHWKMRVHAEAAAEWKQLRAVHCNPTRASIRQHVLNWCRDNGIKTSSHINPSDGYLRTHVLSAKHWDPPPD